MYSFQCFLSNRLNIFWAKLKYYFKGGWSNKKRKCWQHLQRSGEMPAQFSSVNQNTTDSLCLNVAELLLCLLLQLLEVTGQLPTQSSKPPQSSCCCVLLTQWILRQTSHRADFQEGLLGQDSWMKQCSVCSDSVKVGLSCYYSSNMQTAIFRFSIQKSVMFVWKVSYL